MWNVLETTEGSLDLTVRVANVFGRRDACKAVLKCAHKLFVSLLCLSQDSKGSATSEEECRETFTRLGRKWELSLEFMKRLKTSTCNFWALKTDHNNSRLSEIATTVC